MNDYEIKQKIKKGTALSDSEKQYASSIANNGQASLPGSKQGELKNAIKKYGIK